MSQPTARSIDWPIVCFFLIAYGLAWGVQLLIVGIAGSSGLAMDVLQVSAENLNFEPLRDKLTVSPWLVYGLTRIQDFAFSISGLVMIAYVGGTDGLRSSGPDLFAGDLVGTSI